MKNLKIKQLVIGAGLLAIGLLFGRILFGGASSGNGHADHGHETLEEIWTCSMHPQIREDGPGQCPLCGMDLIPLSNSSDQILDVDQIQLSEAAIKLASVETLVVGTSIPQKQVYMPGKIEADERSRAKVTAHFNGRVEKLYADFTGQYIKRGQRLATLYSPDLVTAQKELFETLKFKSTNPSFYAAAVQKLKLWELTDRQIQNIVSSGAPQYSFDVYAPRSGTILTKEISEGEHVMDGQVLFEIANLDRLWVLFDAYESDLPWINVNDSISFNVQSLPGVTFKSVVSFIDPVVNNETRTAAVRTEIVNANKQLKPEMFVEGIVNAGMKTTEETILIPKTAVLWTGKRAVVYVKQPGYNRPTFQFREITLGTDAGEFYVVNDGLSLGDEIVANGVFKIDGAAQLQGKSSMMNPAGVSTSTGHQHGSGPMALPEDERTSSNQAIDSKINKKFQTQIGAIFKAYIPVKDALVKSDVVSTKRMAATLVASINAVDMRLVSGDTHNQWMSHRAALMASATAILNQTDLALIREELSRLSDQLYHTIQRFQVPSGGFRLYCPMAFDDKGAFWLSDSEQVLNPYFGDAMLSCGNVEEKLK